MATQGTTTVNFGAFPGSMDGVGSVTGQAGIVAGSRVEVWIEPIATADHTIDDHIVDPPRVIRGTVTAGSGFPISGFSNNHVPHHGLYTVGWVWN